MKKIILIVLCIGSIFVASAQTPTIYTDYSQFETATGFNPSVIDWMSYRLHKTKYHSSVFGKHTYTNIDIKKVGRNTYKCAEKQPDTTYLVSITKGKLASYSIKYTGFSILVDKINNSCTIISDKGIYCGQADAATLYTSVAMLRMEPIMFSVDERWKE